MRKSRDPNSITLRVRIKFGTIGGGVWCYVQEVPYRNGTPQTKHARTVLANYMCAKQVKTLLDSFPRHEIEAALLRKDRRIKRQGSIRTQYRKAQSLFKETERYFNELSGLKFPNHQVTSDAIPRRATKETKPCKVKS